MLQELVQKKPGSQVIYELVSATGPDHDKEFVFSVKINGEIFGHGHGRSKKEAEQHAAREALDRLGSKPK